MFLLVREVRPTKIKGKTWSTIDHSFFFILNDISKEKNLTFILKIPTRLTGIKSLFVMESPSLPFLSSARTCTHTHSHTHTQAVPGHPLQGVPGPTVLPVELR